MGERCAGSRRRGKGGTLESLRQKDRDQTDLWRVSHPGIPKGQRAGIALISQVQGTEAKRVSLLLSRCVFGLRRRGLMLLLLHMTMDHRCRNGEPALAALLWHALAVSG